MLEPHLHTLAALIAAHPDRTLARPRVCRPVKKNASEHDRPDVAAARVAWHAAAPPGMCSCVWTASPPNGRAHPRTPPAGAGARFRRVAHGADRKIRELPRLHRPETLPIRQPRPRPPGPTSCHTARTSMSSASRSARPSTARWPETLWPFLLDFSPDECRNSGRSHNGPPAQQPVHRRQDDRRRLRKHARELRAGRQRFGLAATDSDEPGGSRFESCRTRRHVQ